MKQVNVVFEDAEMERLKAVKQGTSWHDYAMMTTTADGLDELKKRVKEAAKQEVLK